MQVLYEIAPRGFTSPNGAGVEGAGSGNASVSVILLFVKRLEDGARVLKLIRWPPDLSKLPFPPRAFAPTIYTFSFIAQSISDAKPPPPKTKRTQRHVQVAARESAVLSKAGRDHYLACWILQSKRALLWNLVSVCS